MAMMITVLVVTAEHSPVIGKAGVRIDAGEGVFRDFTMMQPDLSFQVTAAALARETVDTLLGLSSIHAAEECLTVAAAQGQLASVMQPYGVLAESAGSDGVNLGHVNNRRAADAHKAEGLATCLHTREGVSYELALRVRVHHYIVPSRFNPTNRCRVEEDDFTIQLQGEALRNRGRGGEVAKQAGDPVVPRTG